ncbi:MAG: glycine-rich protein [Lachnospiraceae bacterium]
MKAIWMKKGIMTLMAAAVTMSPEQTASEPDHWEYEASQDFTVTSDGIYQFELYGAQGGSYQDNTGGLGGMVNMQVSLHQNDRVELYIGGSNNSQGGGQGTLTSGGGATAVVINGVTVAVAGGGGGATDILNGESGGGNRGIMPDSSIGESSSEPNSAGGGGGYQGGQSGYTRYHEHTGSEESGGGCYTGEIRHTHDGSCFVQCGTFENFRVSDDQPGYIEANCSVCGEWGSNEGDMDSDFITDGSWTHTKRDCGKDSNSIDKYQLSCGKSETMIEENKQAYGGTNYYNSDVCKNVSVAAGVRQGGGKITITQLTKEQLTLNYYNYDMTLLGSVTASKGSIADYPVKTEPARKADSQYSYTFTGWDDMETGRKENLTGADTVQSPVTENKNYIAVYRKIPKEYTVTLEDAYGNVVETITAAYRKQMPDITLPVREDGLFAGYYLQKDGRGTCYYSTSGEAVRKSDIVQDETFYAYWINPVSVTKQPVSVEVESDYEESYMEVAYAQSTEQGYTITPQWYMQQNGKKTKVVNGNTVKCKIPSGYKAGKYTFWCELTVVSEQNGQQIKVSSNQAALQVNQAAEPPKKEDTKPTTPDQDKDNSTGNPGDANNGSTTKPDDTCNGSTTKPGDSSNGSTTKPDNSDSGSTGKSDSSNNETTNKPDNTDNGISGKNDNSSNGNTSKSDIPNNLINGVPGKNDITNINDVTFVLADGLNQIQPPVNSNNTKTEEAPAIENDIQLLTTIPDDTPWESRTSADNTPWINNTGTDDNINHDQDAISPQNPAAYQAELGRANASFLVGLSILGLIAILLLILFLSNNRADRCAEE